MLSTDTFGGSGEFVMEKQLTTVLPGSPPIPLEGDQELRKQLGNVGNAALEWCSQTERPCIPKRSVHENIFRPHRCGSLCTHCTQPAVLGFQKRLKGAISTRCRGAEAKVINEDLIMAVCSSLSTRWNVAFVCIADTLQRSGAQEPVQMCTQLALHGGSLFVTRLAFDGVLLENIGRAFIAVDNLEERIKYNEGAMDHCSLDRMSALVLCADSCGASSVDRVELYTLVCEFPYDGRYIVKEETHFAIVPKVASVAPAPAPVADVEDKDMSCCKRFTDRGHQPPAMEELDEECDLEAQLEAVIEESCPEFRLLREDLLEEERVGAARAEDPDVERSDDEGLPSVVEESEVAAAVVAPEHVVMQDAVRELGMASRPKWRSAAFSP